MMFRPFIKLSIILKKNQILIFLNNKLFFRQFMFIKTILNNYLKLSKTQYIFFYVLHVLSLFGLIPSLRKKNI